MINANWVQFPNISTAQLGRFLLTACERASQRLMHLCETDVPISLGNCNDNRCYTNLSRLGRFHLWVHRHVRQSSFPQIFRADYGRYRRSTSHSFINNGHPVSKSKRHATQTTLSQMRVAVRIPREAYPTETNDHVHHVSTIATDEGWHDKRNEAIANNDLESGIEARLA